MIEKSKPHTTSSSKPHEQWNWGCMVLLFILVLCVAAADAADGLGFVSDVLARLSQNFRPSNEQQMGSIHFGETISDTLDSGSEHVYTFRGERSTVVNLIATTANLDFSPYLILRSSNNQDLVFDTATAGQNAPICRYSLPYNGAYQIVVGGFSSENPRDYRLSLIEPVRESAQPIATGELISGVLSLCEERRFRLFLNHRVTIRITARSEHGTNLEIEMFNEAGTRVVSFDNYNGLRPTAQHENFYPAQYFTIVVSEDYGNAGGFSLRVVEVRP